LETLRGVYIPDELQFRDGGAFFITINSGRQPTPDGDQRVGRYGTMADLTHAARYVRAFCNDLLVHFYGRKWPSRQDIRYSILMSPESKTKGSGERCQLHFHILFDGTGIDAVPARLMNDVASHIWQNLSIRGFQVATKIDVERLRSEEKGVPYAAKWVEQHSPHEREMTFWWPEKKSA
jgi:hypothetical protein